MKKINGYPVNACVVWGPKKIDNELVISIDVSLEQADLLVQEIRITTKDVQLFLEKEKGYKIDKCLKSSVITSSGKKFGSWSFSLKDSDSIVISEELNSNLTFVEKEENVLIQQVFPKEKKKKYLKKQISSETSEKID